MAAFVLLSQFSAFARSEASATPVAPTAELPAVNVVGRASYAPAEADDSYQPTPDASTLRGSTPVLEAPQVVNVVPAQVLRDQRPRQIDDALANVSGITQGNTLAGSMDAVMKRGFGNNRDGSIMHNGMPLVQGRSMTAAAESVEVLKGPTSMLYGIMDPGGVINVVSKKPQLDARTALSVTGSGYAGGRNGGGLLLDSTGPLGGSGLAYRLVVDHVNEDYWRNFGQRRESLIAPSLAWYGRDTQAVLWYEFRDFLTPFDRGTVLDPSTGCPLDVPRNRRLDDVKNTMEGQSHLAQLSVDHRLGDGWSAHTRLSYNRETYDAGQLRARSVNVSNGTLARTNDATIGAVSTGSYGQACVDGNVWLGGVRHALQFGADAEYRKFFRAEARRQPGHGAFNYLHPVYGVEGLSSTVVADDSDQTDKLHKQGLFLHDNIHLDEHLIVAAGLRYQAWSQVAGRGRPFHSNTDIDGGKWIPQLGLIYKLDKRWSLYGNYAESIKPTSSIAPLSNGEAITSDMAPERGKSWEIGAKYERPGQLTATLALFDIKKRNVLVHQYNEAANRSEARTSGAARSRGLELDVAGQVTRQWSGIASLAWLDAKTTEDPLFAGNQLWNVARQTASLSAVYDAGNVLGGEGRLRLGGGAQYVGRRPGDSANNFWLPGYTVAHAFATYDTRVNGYKTNFQLNVKNLFDRLYYPSSVNNYGVAIGDPRQVLLKATVEF